uniref:Anti-lipopolysaccharide factor n=1 Tax=Scylla olivacea TaxID=85551 RepID=A0A0N7ZD98_SCYOL
MHVSQACVVAAVVAVMVVIAPPTPTQAGITDILGSVLGPILKEAIKTREIILLDNYCTMERQPYIKSFEVHYRAEVSCPGWTTIKGRGSNHRNPTNSENAALRDFMTKAVKAGLVTREEAAPWLDNR